MATMQTVQVELGTRSYPIYVSPGLFAEDGNAKELLRPYAAGRKVLIVADSNVAPLYAAAVERAVREVSGEETALCVFPAGEQSKNFETVAMICRTCAQNQLDRGSLIAGLGGGVTGDMAAFAASIYMRGIDCIQVPTSLLAMVDSGAGGKTGVDLPEGKNLIGSFYQPKAVLMDTEFLKTLPRRELINGFAELIKHAILFDRGLFDKLLNAGDDILTHPPMDEMTELIALSCGLKAGVVSRDEQEKGERMLLNLGHTFGHAIEKVQDFCGFEHGEAVGTGLAASARLARKLGLLAQDEEEKIEEIVRKYELPMAIEDCKPEELLHAMYSDKKNRNGTIRLILPHAIGHCEVHHDVPDETILKIWESFLP